MNNPSSFARAESFRVDSEPDAIDVGSDATPLEFLEKVYRSPDQPMNRRLRAAIEAAHYRHPRLPVTANVTSSNRATMLDRAVDHSGKAQFEAAPAIEAPSIAEARSASLRSRPKSGTAANESLGPILLKKSQV
jgi:hypothetical protein